MGVHNNVHIPRESWPHWTWYAIEFGIVLAVSMLVARELTDLMLGNIAGAMGYGAALESWAGINIHSDEFLALEAAIRSPIASISNWVFYGFVGAVFGGWYIVIRGFILKKRILR